MTARTGIVIMRNPMINPFSSCEEMGFVSCENHDCLVLEGEEVPVAQKIWGITAIPHSEDELIKKLSNLGFEQKLCINTIKTLLTQKIILQLDRQVAHDMLIPMQESPICAHLLVCVSGTIQAGNIGPYLKALKTRFCKELIVILTQNAQKMVRSKALRHTLSCEVYTDVYDDVIGVNHVPHVWLSDWAECVLVAPCTANAIHRIANATCDDLLSLTVTATPAETPVILAPSMNVRMWDNPAVQNNLDDIRRRPGYWIIEPGFGVEVNLNWDKRSLIDGGFGAATPADLVRSVENIFEIVCEKDDDI